ncbi:MAG TPA: septum formation initiator family protein [Gammaproteobacteria bacterium]|nr:septum formation initiator family protein [Gammaproteobacteria bacterium]
MKFLLGALVILLVLLQIRLWTGDGGVVKVVKLKEEVNTQKEQTLELSERNHILEAEVQDLKNRLDALEERARTDLGMIKQGETFYQDAS